MKKLINQFLQNEEGVETIEFIALIAVAAALVVVIANIGGSMSQSANDTQQQMTNALESLKNIGG